MAGQQIEVAASRFEKGDRGMLALSLTNYDNDLEPQVAAGSIVEIGDAIFQFTAAESITGWGSIGNNNDVYIKLVVSGTAVTASFTTVAPTWSTSKQGWYDGLDRYVAKLRKDASGNYVAKFILHNIDTARAAGAQWILLSGSGASWEAPWSGAYRVAATGGGGNGGGAGATGQSGGGGGGGGTAVKRYLLTAGQSCTYTVGAAGASSTFTDGTSPIAGTPGSNGQSDGQMTRGGAGGGSTGGDLSIAGQGGGAGFNNGSNTFGVGGAGGGSHFGGGARGVIAGDNGQSATGRGGGGSGGCYGSGAVSGGAGAAGIIVIEYLGPQWTA